MSKQNDKEDIHFPSYEPVSIKQEDKEDVYAKLVESMQKKGRKEVATIGPYIADCTLSSTVYPRRGYLLLNNVMTDQTASQEGEVKEVLEKIFTGPDVELKSLMDQ
ncbi:hypothetical protein [Rossellomorea marisflavi]|uniref:hypothetical protein n=1 Tax=Rossellomorea marisflavi TaxID=189381 RepID=UPI00345851B4